jgi:alpha-ketoglutarate-dependent taurine dioxygenase
MPGTITRLVTRGRAIPWLALYESGKWIYGHGKRAWENLDPPERERLGGLLRKSKGRRSNLSTRERDELQSLVKKAVTGTG